MSKHYDMEWIFESFPENQLLSKRMFGGTAFYFSGRMILVVMASPGDRIYRGKEFSLDIWNGFLFPTDREHHIVLQNKYPALIEHPVLKKWLYLPFDSEDFEFLSADIFREMRRGEVQWGIWPKERQTKKKRPLGSDAKISQLLNLGPATERLLSSAGIKSVAQLKKWGWKKAFLKVAAKDAKRINLNLAYALIGALDNRDWRHLPAKKKKEAQNLVAQLRKDVCK
jgi:hypothetical protein